MSLINQMLKDLDKRKADGTSPEALPRSVHIVDEPPSQSRSGGPGAVVVGLLLAAVMAGGAWWYFGRSRPQTPPPMISTNAPAVTPITLATQDAPPRPTPPPNIEPAQPPAEVVTAPPRPQPAASPSPRSVVAAKSGPVSTDRTRRRGTPHHTVAQLSAKARDVENSQAVKPGLGQSGNVAEEHYRRALRLQENGDEGRARDELEAALRLAPDHEAARRTLAKSYAASGQYQRAEGVLGERHADGETTSLRAQIYLQQGKTEQAERALDEGPASDDEPDQLAVKGALRQKQGRYDEAAVLYGKAARSQPSQAKWWLGLAISLEGNERYQDAVEAYRHVLDVGAPSRDVRRYVESRIDTLTGGH